MTARLDLHITPIRTATVLIRVGDTTILTDPWFGLSMNGIGVLRQPALGIDDLPPIDLVLASHLHGDHFEPAAVERLASPKTRIVGPVGTLRLCRHRGVDGALLGRIVELEPWQEATVAGISLLAGPAEHTGPPPAELNYVADIGGWRVFFGGDAQLSAHHSEFGARGGPIDVALVPVGGSLIWLSRTTMDPADAVQACARLGARWAIGIHEGGEWRALPPLSLHPGRRADFDRLLDVADGATKPVACGPGSSAIFSGDAARVQGLAEAAA